MPSQEEYLDNLLKGIGNTEEEENSRKESEEGVKDETLQDPQIDMSDMDDLLQSALDAQKADSSEQETEASQPVAENTAILPEETASMSEDEINRLLQQSQEQSGDAPAQESNDANDDLIKMLENADDEGLSNILDQVTPETAQPEETAEREEDNGKRGKKKKEKKKLNDEKFQKREGSRKSVYMDEEKDFMNPLPEHPFELSEWKMATVQLNYHIQVEKMNYSIPYEYVGKRVEVKLTKDTVTVYYKKNQICQHKRLYGHRNQYSTNEAHMPKNHQLFQWNKERFMNWATTIGPSTVELITLMFSRYKVEEQAYKGCLSILKLSDKYSQARLENACKLALSRLSNPTYKNIKLILESDQDEVKREPERMTNKEDTTYAFTRGAEYYGGKK